MESFDYDCFGAVNSFCNNNGTLQNDIIEASTVIDLDLDDSFDEIAATKGKSISCESDDTDLSSTKKAKQRKNNDKTSNKTRKNSFVVLTDEDDDEDDGKKRKKNNKTSKKTRKNSFVVLTDEDDDEDDGKKRKKNNKTSKKTRKNSFVASDDDDEDVESNYSSLNLSDSQKKLRRSRRKRTNLSIDLTNYEPPILKSKRIKKNDKIILIDVDAECNISSRDNSYVGNCSSFLSETELTDNIILKVQWKNNIEKISYRKYQNFVDLMDLFAKRESCSINDILFNLESKIINSDDTPHSIDYKFADIICGRVVLNCNKETALTKINKKGIMLRVQSSIWKVPIELFIEKHETFAILCLKLAEETKLKIDDFSLIFDGDPIDITETPNDLDLEGGELIDCKVKIDATTADCITATKVKSKQKKSTVKVRKSKRRQ